MKRNKTFYRVFDLVEKGHDIGFIWNYLLDHDHYWNIHHKLGHDYLSDWEKEDWHSIRMEMFDRSGACAVATALRQEGIE